MKAEKKTVGRKPKFTTPSTVISFRVPKEAIEKVKESVACVIKPFEVVKGAH